LGRIPSGISDMQVQVYGYQGFGHSIVFQCHHAFHIGVVLLIGDVQKKYPATLHNRIRFVKDSALYSHVPHNNVSVIYSGGSIRL
jgi:hypothetical protein